jgi:CDGSH-type Zn-finger protein
MKDPEEKPIVIFTKTSAYKVIDLKRLKRLEGQNLAVKSVMFLCRCGASGNKPYCDGTHSRIGFVGEKKPDRVDDRVVEYRGREITIVDNRGICSHDGACFRNLPQVFMPGKFRWIRPNEATREEIIRTIRMCPSGALSYQLGGKRYQDLDREPAIIVVKNGPFEIIGGIKLKDDMDSRPESKENYTLCRCGGSKNHPFCDGSHLKNGFQD